MGVKVWRALNWPNRITLMRLLLIWPFVVLLLDDVIDPWARRAALAIFVVMGVSDFVDGVLARRLNARTRLGAILDPLADKGLIISAVVLLSRKAAQGAGIGLPHWVVAAVVAKDLWVVVGWVVVYLVTDRLRVHPTQAGKACTVVQIVMVAWALLAPDLNGVLAGLGSGGIAALSWAVAAASVWAIISYTRLGLHFTMAEGKPLEDNGQPDNKP